MADLKRMGLLRPIVDGRVRAITWKNDGGGLDKLGIIPGAKGIRFVKRDDEGKLAGLFVPYFLAFGAESVPGETPSLGRTRPSLPRCVWL